MPNILRPPHPSEEDYFRKNPNVAGMAAQDNRVVMNPFSALNEQERNAVYQNELARIYMRRYGGPKFGLTDAQKKAFSQYGSEQDMRDTIAGRLYSGDPSAGEPTPEQIEYVEKLKTLMSRMGGNLLAPEDL